MFAVVSPAKTLDFDTPSSLEESTQPRFVSESERLVKVLKKKKPKAIKELMGVSDALAELNFQRYQDWTSEFSLQNAKQAVLAFKGDVYTGLDAESFGTADFEFAQKHLGILSGLYGLLRPLDLMQPYRLEMGTRLQVTPKTKNLYQFWDNKITTLLETHLGSDGVLINLASNEYFKSVKAKSLQNKIITVDFKDLKNGEYKMIGFLAKKARGQMARFMIKNQLTSPEDLKAFDVEGYYFNNEMSSEEKWVFTRDKKP